MKNKQINVRFSDETDQVLTDTAAKLGVSRSALVRHLTEQFLAETTRTGSLRLKPHWVGNLAQADARSQWGTRKGGC